MVQIKKYKIYLQINTEFFVVLFYSLADDIASHCYILYFVFKFIHL